MRSNHSVLSLVWEFLILMLATTLVLAEPPKTFKVGEFNFARPNSWEWVEVASPMRKAELKVVAQNQKDTAEVIFFHFSPGSGGGTQANVERWFHLFKEPKERTNARTEAVTVGKRKVIYANAEGTYLSGLPGETQTAKPGYALAGAIIESSQGNVFIRMTGPASLVKASQVDFRQMAESALKAK
jgi:hypothetical protein